MSAYLPSEELSLILEETSLPASPLSSSPVPSLKAQQYLFSPADLKKLRPFGLSNFKLTVLLIYNTLIWTLLIYLVYKYD